MARPLKDINPQQVYRLARIGCTSVEIATVMSCSVDTLERRFADVIKKGREKCKMSLRRLQLKIAFTGSNACSAGNPGMAIWLGKQLLNQRERTDLDVNFIDSEIERRLAELATRSEAEIPDSSESVESIN